MSNLSCWESISIELAKESVATIYFLVRFVICAFNFFLGAMSQNIVQAAISNASNILNYIFDLRLSIVICLWLFLQVTEENVYSVLCFADVYLLNGLKRFCARAISTFLDTENVLTVLRTSRLFNLPKLEADCCEYVSKHLEKVRKN